MPADNMDRNAYVYVPGNVTPRRIALVVFEDNGYYPTTYDTGQPEAECRRLVRSLNARNNIPEAIEDAMLFGSMFGWNIRAARAACDFFRYR